MNLIPSNTPLTPSFEAGDMQTRPNFFYGQPREYANQETMVIMALGAALADKAIRAKARAFPGSVWRVIGSGRLEPLAKAILSEDRKSLATLLGLPQDGGRIIDAVIAAVENLASGFEVQAMKRRIAHAIPNGSTPEELATWLETQAKKLRQNSPDLAGKIGHHGNTKKEIA